MIRRNLPVAFLICTLPWILVCAQPNNVRRHETPMGRQIPVKRWDYWTQWSDCSVDCGTGVTKRSRECRSMLDGQVVTGCAGNANEIKICEITGCIREAHEITACRKLELNWYSGKRYRWSPYTHPVNPCELACRPDGGSFYMGLGMNVSDGTPCGPEGTDKSKVCVYGLCQSLGCDDVVGSDTQVDRCGVCGGAGNTCRQVSKTFSGSVMYGYHKIATIPAGSTNIRITELTPSRNYLAARSVDGTFRINTLFRLSRYGDHPGLGTLITYSSQSGPDCPGECITAEGPIDTALEVMILAYVHNDGISYSYNVPAESTDTLYTNGEESFPSMVYIDGGIIPNPDTRKEDTGNKRHIFSSDFKFKKKNRNHHRRGQYNSNHPDDRKNREHETVNIESNGASIHRDANTGNEHEANTTIKNTGQIYGNVNASESKNIEAEDEYDDYGRRDADVYNESKENHENNTPNQYGDSNENDYDEITPETTHVAPNNENYGSNYDHVNSKEVNFENKDNYIYSNNDIVTESKNDDSGKDLIHTTAHESGVERLEFEYTVPTTPFIVAASSGVPSSSTAATTDAYDNGNGDVEEDKGDEGDEEEDEGSEETEEDEGEAVDSSEEDGFHTDPSTVIGEISQRNTSAAANTNIEIEDDDDEDVGDENSIINGGTRPDMYNNDNQIPSLYSWQVNQYSQCSQSCGEGKQSPVFECIVTDKGVRVDQSYCSDLDTPQHPTRSCNYGPCPPSWKPRSWSQCSVTCDVGTQSRGYVCTRSDGVQVSDNQCSSVRPRSEERTCDMGSCTHGWYHTEWPTECNAQCGYGEIRRRVYCASDPSNVATSCPQNDKPEVSKTCQNDDCTPFWLTGPWSKCNATCGEAYQTRSVACAQKQRQRITVVTDAACSDEEMPPTFMSCDLGPCKPDWFMSDFGECSVSCGEGFKSRDVRCLDHKFRSVGGCQERLKPETREPCTMRACPVVYQPPQDRPTQIPRPRPEPQTSPSHVSDTPPANCQDSFSQCSMVIRARLCRYGYYAKICCLSCSRTNYRR